MSDPAKYRSRAELEERKKKDPIMVTKEKLQEAGAKLEELDEIEEAVEAQVKEAVKAADQAEPAKESVMFESVMATKLSPQNREEADR